MRGYVVRSFLEDQGQHDKVKNLKTKSSNFIPMNPKGLPYDLVKADPSIDVWALGVLMFHLHTGRPLFKVNRDMDLDDGDKTGNLFRDLQNWNGIIPGIDDPEARRLLQKILQPDPQNRPSMKQILEDHYFNPQRHQNYEDVTEAIKYTQTLILDNQKIMEKGFDRLIKYQKSTNNMLKGIIKDESIMPKYFAILPKEKSEGFQKILEVMNPATLVTNTVRLVFICPVTLQCAFGADGEPISYDVDLPPKWVKEYGPSILFGLKILNLGFSVGRGFGLPMPSLAGAEEKLLGTSSFLTKMQEIVVKEMGGGKGGSIANKILSDTIENTIDGVEEGVSDANPLSKKQQEEILKSFQGIGKLINDEKFKHCGLIQTDGPYGSIEFVHPDAAPVYKELGEECFQKDIDEIDRLVAIERVKTGATKKRDQSVVDHPENLKEIEEDTREPPCYSCLVS